MKCEPLRETPGVEPTTTPESQHPAECAIARFPPHPEETLKRG
ncbi:hypothetical protein [Phormidium sp. CCY1219]|nr:hypothetical protein [Phormidium sp. CCY1219]